MLVDGLVKVPPRACERPCFSVRKLRCQELLLVCFARKRFLFFRRFRFLSCITDKKKSVETVDGRTQYTTIYLSGIPNIYVVFGTV